LLDSLFRIDRTNEYLLITDPQHSGAWEYLNIEELIVPTANPAGWMAWSNAVLPELLAQRKIPIYHTLKHITAFRIKARKVVTFHGAEMIYQFADLYKWYDLLYWRSTYSLAARMYDRIITATHAEKDAFTSHKGIADDKFRVIPFGVGSHYRLIEDTAALAEARRRLDLPERFILFVGRFHPIKNVQRLLEAHQIARTRLPERFSLVLVAAAEGQYYEHILGRAQRLGIIEDVRFIGHLTEDLPYVYNLAELFVLPSLHENFGFALLEAMSCGLPVIASNIHNLDEVVGEAAFRVDPACVDQIAGAIVDILSSESLRHDLIAKSLAQVRRFSWDLCARKTLQVYEDLAANLSHSTNRTVRPKGDKL
jgi:glycosyltransferase involved in cell wall biosynthesis